MHMDIQVKFVFAEGVQLHSLSWNYIIDIQTGGEIDYRGVWPLYMADSNAMLLNLP